MRYVIFIISMCLITLYSYGQISDNTRTVDGNLILHAGNIAGSVDDTGTNFVFIGITNFTSIDSPTNYLSYDPATRLLTGCVTNLSTGGGSSTHTNLFSPYELVSAPTVTVTSAMTSLISLYATNDIEEFTFDSDWTTNDYGSVNLQLYLGTNSIGFDTNTIYSVDIDALTDPLSTNSTETLLFEKRKWETLWHVYQID